MLRHVLPFFLVLGSAAAQHPDARQIHWQRSLEDALAVAAATHRPLLVAVNMDGESASDRIVHENYRDPAFVAATRSCVCVVASVFRHNARDHDDDGRRIPCPRLGEVTCGEHLALEPRLFDSLLADGERVAPRHALVLPDGKKAWDLSLSFDLHDIDRALVASVRDLAAPERGPRDRGSWVALAARRDHRGRARLEAAFARARADDSIIEGLDAVAQHGDSGSRDALRVLAASWPRLTPRVREQLIATTRRSGLEPDVAAALRDTLRSIGDAAAATQPGGRASALTALAALDGGQAATRSLLLACRAVDAYDATAIDAVRDAFGDRAAAIEASLETHGGPFGLSGFLQAASTVATSGGFAPRPKTVDPELPATDALIEQLTALDERMRAADAGPALLAEYAKASLDLARRHAETGASDVPILLEDAELHFRRALEQDGAHATWWIERARAAYFLQRFEQQVEFGHRALALATGRQTGTFPDERATRVLDDEVAIEALRWIGDGNARLLAARSGQDPAIEIGGMVDGLRALALAAQGEYGDAKDWLSLASFCGALGLWREELAITVAGALRQPASVDLRQALNAALWNGGRIELAPAVADRIADSNPPSAETAWFCGYARILAAEDDRRREDLETAIRDYAGAADRFEQAGALNRDYADNCNYWLAMTWLGRGLAHVRAQRREDAAACLAAAVSTGAAIHEVRDGLGYDVLDLVDKILEWRERGPSPVTPLALLDRLDEVAAADPFWAIAVADSALREALRADGRNPDRALRETVDAAGDPITMLMGKPCEDGDALLRASIEAGRRAVGRADGSTDLESRTLAQSATIWAERMLERDRDDDVRAALSEAAQSLAIEPPPEDADQRALRAFAARLRSTLGDARPRWRAGR